PAARSVTTAGAGASVTAGESCSIGVAATGAEDSGAGTTGVGTTGVGTTGAVSAAGVTAGAASVDETGATGAMPRAGVGVGTLRTIGSLPVVIGASKSGAPAGTYETSGAISMSRWGERGAVLSSTLP